MSRMAVWCAAFAAAAACASAGQFQKVNCSKKIRRVAFAIENRPQKEKYHIKPQEVEMMLFLRGISSSREIRAQTRRDFTAVAAAALSVDNAYAATELSYESDKHA